MCRKLTTKEFIQKAKKIHGDKYDYSLTYYVKIDVEITVICPVHGKILQYPYMHLKSGCKLCKRESISKKRTLTTNEFINSLSDNHKQKYNYSNTVYKNAKTKLKYICPEHGEIEQLPYRHRDSGCPMCNIDRRSLSIDKFIKKANLKYKNKYDYSLITKFNKKSKLKIICPQHGVFEQTATYHLLGNGCGSCRMDERRLREENEFKKICSIRHKNKYDYSKVKYEPNVRKVCISCQIHGDFWQDISKHLSGQGCPKCGKKRANQLIASNTKEFIEKARIIHDNKYDYSLVNYESNKKKVKIICLNHGIFEQIPNSHLLGKGCQKCCFKKSGFEQSIKVFLDKLNLTYSECDRKTISPYELDFVLKDRIIAIECDGIYWHSEKILKDKNYHLNKTQLCKEKGLLLIHIFENEFAHKKRTVLTRLKHILGLNKYKIFARKCKAKEIPTEWKNKFLEKYHLQGSDKSSVKLGLFYKNRMIAVMTFCKNRKALGKSHVEGEWELSRFATIGNFSIVGGAGKLLKYFERNWQPKKITSYADRRWSEGKLYEKIGFIKIRESTPNYWYFNDTHRLKIYHRFAFRKSELSKKLDRFDPNMTEWENMKENGWNRIWDCGNLVFEKVY